MLISLYGGLQAMSGNKEDGTQEGEGKAFYVQFQALVTRCSGVGGIQQESVAFVGCLQAYTIHLYTV